MSLPTKIATTKFATKRGSNVISVDDGKSVSKKVKPSCYTCRHETDDDPTIGFDSTIHSMCISCKEIYQCTECDDVVPDCETYHDESDLVCQTCVRTCGVCQDEDSEHPLTKNADGKRECITCSEKTEEAATSKTTKVDEVTVKVTNAPPHAKLVEWHVRSVADPKTVISVTIPFDTKIVDGRSHGSTAIREWVADHPKWVLHTQSARSPINPSQYPGFEKGFIMWPGLSCRLPLESESWSKEQILTFAKSS